MRGKFFFLAAVFMGGAARAAVDPSGGGLMQEAVAAYREGRLEDALLKMGQIVEEDPANATAKNYIWVIARKIQKERKDAVLSEKDVRRATAAAEAELEERRRRTRQTLGKMKEVAALSGNVRSPQDVLAGVDGLERFIGKDLGDELADAQAKAFLDQIAAHLAAALQKNIFVSLKDQFRVAGYLAYVQNDWEKAADFWRKALREEPDDRDVRRDLQSLEALVKRKDRGEKVQELVNQAKLCFRTGRYAEAVEAWEGAAKLDPSFPGVAEQAAVARTALEKDRLQKKLKAMTDDGLVIYRRGDVFGAAQRWLEVLQLDPTFEDARAWLRYAGRRMQPAAAEKPARAAAPREDPGVTADPEKALKYYKEGMILYSQGNLTEAIQAWEESSRLDPSLSRAREAIRQASAEISFK